MYYTRSMLLYCVIHYSKLYCICYNHIIIGVTYYSLLNSSLPYVLCYMLYVIYCVYIYHICVAYVSVGPDQRGLLCAESGFGMRGFQGHMSHAIPPLSLSLPRPTLNTEMLLQNCSRTMQKRGAACNYKKGMQSPLQYSDSFKTAQGTVYKTSTSQ